MITPLHLLATKPKLTPADSDRTMLIDTFALAAHVEIITAPYWRSYPEGLYLRGRAEPVMLVGYNYYEQDTMSTERTSVIIDGQTVPKFKNNKSTIYDERDNVVGIASNLRGLSYTPEVPSKGLAVVEGYIKKLVNDHGHWPHGLPVETTEDILQADMLPHWVWTSVDEVNHTMLLKRFTDEDK